MEHRKTTIITIILIFTLLSNSASATSAGISPPNITLNNAMAEKTYKVNFTIYNLGNESTDYSISSRGNITNWTHTSKNEVRLDGKKALPMTAEISIPSDTKDGIYSGNILVKSIPNESVIGNKVSVGVSLPITLIVSNPTKAIQPLTVGILLLLAIVFCYGILKTIKAMKSKERKQEGELNEN